VHRLLAAATVAALTAPAPAFHFTDPRIVEASGLAFGLRSPGVAYVQNDSGDANRFFAVDRRTGATAATVSVAGATNVDWEDIAVAPDATGLAQVWLADTGDNGAVRREVRIYRVREPHVARTDRGRAIRTERAAVWRLRYPDGPVDAEGLAVARGGAAYVVTKSAFGRSAVYQLPAHPDARHVQLLRKVGTIALVPQGVDNPLGIPGELAITGAAISPDGSLFAVRTYAEAYLWRLGAGGIAAALRSGPRLVPLPRQPQGEGIALADDRHAWVDSEGLQAAVFDVRLPEVPAPTAEPTAAPTSGSPSVQATQATTQATQAATKADPAARRDRSPPLVLAGLVLAGLAVAAVLALAVWRFRAGTRSRARPRSR
jgi:hypothetical protein